MRAASLQDLCDVSKYSYVTIHDYIRKLTDAEIIAKSVFDGDGDGRCVRYTLTEKGGKILDNQYGHVDKLR